MSQDRSNPPPGYIVSESEDDEGEHWPADIETSDGFCVDGRSREEAVAACWEHSDRVAADGFTAASDGLATYLGQPKGTIETRKIRSDVVSVITQRDREQQAKALEEAVGAMRDEHVDVEVFADWLRERAEKVRRGDA